ncbi:MAG: SDR family NAD(P)-dependent oxidoreductase [Oscillatoriaceae cyanobacterium Prado104]|jgi:short-subunit dehydrogenase|nr:SDR family NAD(P)-dependent oxidoreductase [Oscillatoriaceae cyanobacterium Prado104]
MIVFITGGSSGIGRRLVLHYLARGCSVAAVARREANLADLYQSLASDRGLLRTYCADITDKQIIAQTIAKVEQELGAIDLAIINAGVTYQQLEPNLDLECFNEVMLTNAIGSTYTLVPIVETMLKRGRGQIVGISSLAAIGSIPRMSTYCASKAALNYQLEGFYWTLKPHGISVTTICPGFIETEMTVKHQIPRHWCMTLDRAIPQIVKAIEQKQRLYCFPFWQYQFVRLLGIMPDRIKEHIFNHAIEKWFPRPPLSLRSDRA